MNFLANPIDEWLLEVRMGWGGVGKLGVTTDEDISFWSYGNVSNVVV